MFTGPNAPYLMIFSTMAVHGCPVRDLQTWLLAKCSIFVGIVFACALIIGWTVIKRGGVEA